MLPCRELLSPLRTEYNSAPDTELDLEGDFDFFSNGTIYTWAPSTAQRCCFGPTRVRAVREVPGRPEAPPPGPPLQQCAATGAGDAMNGPQLSEVPDDSELLEPFVRGLRRGALRAGELRAVRTFSRGFLVKFLRARDFDVELSLKVRRHLADERTACAGQESSVTLPFRLDRSSSLRSSAQLRCVVRC